MKIPSLLPLACVAMIAPLHAQVPPASEQEVLLNTTDLLPREILLGSSYRVRDQTATDGYMAHFVIDSDFGTFTAIGVPEAKKRIAEAEAIRKLVETSKGDLFAEGLKRSIEQPIDAVKNIVANPVDSVKATPKTVGHFFTKVGSAIGRGVSKTVDQVQDASRDPNGTDAGQAATQAGKGIGQAAKNAAGFDKAKLDTAKQLGVDPYSDNPRLQEEMEKVTWAFFAGGLPLRVGAAVASAGVAVAATNMVGIPEDTYALTSSELELRDGRSLSAMGITDDDVKEFQLNRLLTLTRRHRIVKYLEAMPKATGRGYMVQLANACASPEQADILIGALAILAERQRNGEADYVALKVLGRLPGAATANGEVQVPAPVDYVTWTPEVAGFAQRDDLGTGAKVLVHTGKLSQAAASGLVAFGWKVIGVPYPKN